ncbi:ATP-dependent helicase, partial [Candidatus Saccharibacteria bacterium]|nr:ATP-dependent helicase [Candidatus Saccharibacteria bacterium]
HIFLTKNYRSGKAILDFAHNIIEQSDDRFCKAPNVNIDKRITAENPPTKTNIELREFKAHLEEYSFVARKIHQLIAAGTPGNQIAIIAPKHKYLTSILPYLHKLEIPVSYSRRENILESPRICELIDFARLLIALAKSPKTADPFWFRILSFESWGLKSKDIISVVQKAKASKRSIIEEMFDSNEDIQAIAEYCTKTAAKIDNYSAEYIINDITNTLYDTSASLEFYSNLNTLRDMIITKDAHTSKKYTLRDFIDTIEAYQNAEMTILNKSPYHESDFAVQMHTVHSSKGLEFEHVFMIACDNKNWSDAKGNTDKFTLPRNLEHIRHTGDSAAEKIRVIFVAITRARANLYLTYSLSDFAGHECDRLKYLDIRTEKDANGEEIAVSRVLDEDFAKVIPSDADAIVPDIISPDKWFDNYCPTSEISKNLLKPYVEHFRLSPTHLNTFIDLKHAGPEEFLRRYIIGVPGESNFAIKYGVFVHEIMDEMNREQLSNEQALERFRVKVNEADAEDDEKASMLQRGEIELAKFLADRGDELRSTHADSERGFFTESIVLGDVPITGKIDRIEIDDESRTITVADFKTGRPKTKWSTADSTFTYKIQLYFYKFLIEGSREYANYKVTKGRLDYIPVSEEDGETHSLEVVFKDSEAAEIRQLIQRVYESIVTLNLPDTTEANQSNNPTKAFYDQLLCKN